MSVLIVGVLLVLRATLDHYAPDLKSYQQPYQAAFYSAALFVQAVIVSASVSEYKLAEALPGSIAASLITALEAVSGAIEDEPSLRVHAGDILGHTLGIVDAQIDVAMRSTKPGALERAWEETGRHARGATKLLRAHGAREEAKALQDACGSLRAAAARFVTVSITDFLPAAYPLYYTINVMTAVSLFLTDFDSSSEKWIVSSTLTFILTYLTLLITSVDSPLHLPALESAAALAEASGGVVLVAERRSGRSTALAMAGNSDDAAIIAPLITVRSRVATLISAHKCEAAALNARYGEGAPAPGGSLTR